MFPASHARPRHRCVTRFNKRIAALLPGLRGHGGAVERGRPVLLRRPSVDEPEQEALIRRRARWIRERLVQVNMPLTARAVIIGSRPKYAGRSYFTEVRHAPGINKPVLFFTASRFIIENPHGASIEPDALMPVLSVLC